MKKIKIVRHRIEKVVLNKKTIFFVYDIFEIDESKETKTIDVYRIYEALEIWDYENQDEFQEQIEEAQQVLKQIAKEWDW